MSVVFLPGAEQHNEYTQRFRDASLQELIDAYNREVPITAWLSARGRFLAAMGKEFRHRSVDSSMIETGENGLTLSETVAFDALNNCLVPAE